MSERSVVQDPLLKYTNEIGRTQVTRSEAMQMRGGNTSALYFQDTLKSQLLKLNNGIIDDANCADVIRILNLLKPTLEGNQEALNYIRQNANTQFGKGRLFERLIRAYLLEDPSTTNDFQRYIYREKRNKEWEVLQHPLKSVSNDYKNLDKPRSTIVEETV